jgi:asparagine synthase (glutamine-hydrolysing)
MTAQVRHRGPDGHGIWLDGETSLALGHCRLAVMDLSPAGHQPMESENGRFVLTFNGEIYNFVDLRRELEQRSLAPLRGWRGHSDTEVLLQAIAWWGVEQAVAKCSGMFAFGLWDRQERRLTLGRDRFGEKPLYYGWAGRQFVFASELKALRAHPDFDNSISDEALGLFLSSTYVPAPLSIFRRIYKLPAGCILQATEEAALHPQDTPADEGDPQHGIRITRYWSYRDVLERGIADPIVDECEALERLEAAISRSVRRQSVADVPTAAFLSGGVDSSLIVALHQQQSSRTVQTYSIGFTDAAYNEAHHASAVAAHLGTSHNEEYIDASHSRDLIPSLPRIYDEPFADASQIATHLLCRFARRDAKVALTGDGADELFAGYYHHFLVPKVWRSLQKIPKPLRKTVISALSRVPTPIWEQAAGRVAGRKQKHIGSKIQKALRAASDAQRLDVVYRDLREEWDLGALPLVNPSLASVPLHVSLGPGASDEADVMYYDALSYLPDDILCKVDRAAMAVSLETRVPFLDHEVAEVAARIPLSMKVRNGRGKFILRKLLHRHLPRELVERPKNGFAVPVGEWLKGPLRSWADDVLDQSRIRRDGWFDADVIGQRWKEHLSGRRDSSGALWAVLMFQSWVHR